MYLFSRRARAPSGRDSSQPSTHLQDTFSRRSQPNTFLSILNTSQLLSFNSQFFISFFRSDWVPGLPSSPEHDWRTTDWKSKRWNSFQKSILTMVTSTLIMLILHLQDLIINANIVNIEKSNKANNKPRRERESNNNKEMLLWILSLFNAPS